tara:strand:+ start:275 stop:529 length:255 start_codon:yes stop_codon:yes gene_type:complete
MSVANRLTRLSIDQEGTVTYFDVTWEMIRFARDESLKATDWWAMSDRTMTDAQKNYRTFLRDMPSNYSTANDAADAWSAYDIPE